VSELKRRGVVFEEYDMPPGLTTRNSIATGGGAKTAWFKDTEGNILAISQRLQRAGPHLQLDPGTLGAAFFIPTAIVPPLL
jgi:hypothetical protein